MNTNSGKRNRNDADFKQSSSKPPHKKQKLANDTLETKDDIQISLKMHTKLGDSHTSFNTNDLQKIFYFRNQLSQRWNSNNNSNSNSNICTITSNDLCFSVDEVAALIFYKTHNKLDTSYPFHRLAYICNAFAYFAETIESNAFKIYFADCIPAIKYKDLLDLKLLCQKTECANLLTAIDATIKQITDKDKEMAIKIINNWKSVPIELLTSNANITVGVFTKSLVIVQRRLWFTVHRSCSDLNKLWNCICDRKMYLFYPTIIAAVYKLNVKKSSYYGVQSEQETLSVITNIVADVMQICLENDLKFSQKNHLMINNIFYLMSTEKSISYLSRSDAQNKQTAQQFHFHYDFLFVVLKKLVDLRNKNQEKYLIHFGNEFIVKLLREKFDKIALVAQWRNFLNDVGKLKVDEQFTKIEQHQLLKSVLKNYQKMKLNEHEQNSQNFIKKLIEIDFEQSFKLANLWFPIVMKHHKSWIVNELPKKTSLRILQILLDGINKYIISKEFKNTEFDTSYFQFINQYTNAQWNINQ